MVNGDSYEDLHRLNKAPPAYLPLPSDVLGAAIPRCAPSARGRHPIRTWMRTISRCSSPSSATSRTTTAAVVCPGTKEDAHHLFVEMLWLWICCSITPLGTPKTPSQT
ncbi:hypothetical protein PVAP13_8NG177101 [Panicum virgatum]|uniref:Uncharacterized protein n=1 Tax=Panicum virgatum TaxID=38727 RepID=A0A8T0P836_PANVG|nr:hypothetical protein PVAP13_8NG177101 [Panicum virgatum]